MIDVACSLLLVTAVATFALAFLAGSPFVVLDPSAFRQDFQFDVEHLAGGHGIVVANAWRQHLAFSLRHGVGLPVLLAGAAGAVLMAMRNWRTTAVVMSFPVLYYVIIGAGRTAFARYAFT